MKRIILYAAIIGLTACQTTEVERTWQCKIENWTPEGITYHHEAIVPFSGTYSEMKAFESANSFSTSFTTQTCKCY